MPLLISKKKEHQLLQHSSALREYLEMQGSCLVPALFVFIKSWLGVFMVQPQTWNLQGAGTVLNPQRAKMFQNGKFLPIRETSGVETTTESLGKEKPSTRKHEPGCGLERGWGNKTLCNWKHILEQGQATYFKLLFTVTSPAGLHFRAQQFYEMNLSHASLFNLHISLQKECNTSGHSGPSQHQDSLGQGWIHSPLAFSLQPNP